MSSTSCYSPPKDLSATNFASCNTIISKIGGFNVLHAGEISAKLGISEDAFIGHLTVGDLTVTGSNNIVVPIPDVGSVSNILVVSQNGSDVTGDGSFVNPYQTITYAMSQVTGAYRFNRFAIFVAPGFYQENIVHKPNVWICGFANQNCPRIVGNITLDPTFANTFVGPYDPLGSSDNRSGLKNLTLTGTITADFATISSMQGKYYLDDANVNSNIIFTAFNTINQLVMQNVLLFGQLIQTGGQVLLQNAVFQGLGPSINTPVATGINTFFTATGGYCPGDLTGTAVGINTLVLQILSYPIMGTTTINGNINTNLIYTVDSCTSPPVLSGGAVSTLVNDCSGLKYSPDPINWAAPPPNNVNSALERMATLLKALNGGVVIP